MQSGGATLHPEDVPEICKALIEEGLDSPTLQKLAATKEAGLNEVPQLLPRLFSESGMEERAQKSSRLGFGLTQFPTGF